MLFQVQKDVSCLSLGDMDIPSYYTKAKQLWDESNAVSEVLAKNVSVRLMEDCRIILRKGS